MARFNVLQACPKVYKLQVLTSPMEMTSDMKKLFLRAKLDFSWSLWKTPRNVPPREHTFERMHFLKNLHPKNCNC